MERWGVEVNCESLSHYATVVLTVPRIAIKTGLVGSDGREEVLTEYMCDFPGCPNIASEVLGCVPQLGLVSVVCHEHVPPKQR